MSQVLSSAKVDNVTLEKVNGTIRIKDERVTAIKHSSDLITKAANSVSKAINTVFQATEDGILSVTALTATSGNLESMRILSDGSNPPTTEVDKCIQSTVASFAENNYKMVAFIKAGNFYKVELNPTYFNVTHCFFTPLRG